MWTPLNSDRLHVITFFRMGQNYSTILKNENNRSNRRRLMDVLSKIFPYVHDRQRLRLNGGNLPS